MTDLTPIAGSPGYFTGETGRVWKLGHPKLGAVAFRLKPTAEISHTPGSGIIRRTGRFFFPVYRDGRLVRHYWTPPPEDIAPQPQQADDEDDCPF